MNWQVNRGVYRPSGAFDPQPAGGLNYDFTSASLPAGVSSSGATNGTRTNSSGALVSGTSPRYDYSSAGVFSGLLNEPAATNSLTYSNDFSNGAWSYFQATSAQDVTGLDGLTSAWTLTASATGVAALVGQAVSLASGSTHSVYAKAGTDSYFYIQVNDPGGAKASWINLATGVAATSNVTLQVPSLTLTPVTGVAVGNGWYRLSVTHTGAAATNLSFGFSDADASRAVTAGKTGFVTCAQAELGSVATTYIPTTTTSLTRTADATTFTIPGGVTNLLYTFDNSSTQSVSVSSGAYSVPTTLNRSSIRTIVGS